MPRQALPVPVQEAVIPTLGTQPLKVDNRGFYQDLLQKVTSAQTYGRNNPIWGNDQAELALMRASGSSMTDEIVKALSALDAPLQAGNININDRFSKRHTVADLNIPRSPEAMVSLSLRYSYENSFVAKALRVKTDFTIKNFQHQTQVSAAKEFYDDYADDLHLYVALRKICWHLYSVGVCPVYWGGEDGSPIKYLWVMDPRTCHFTEMFGRQKLFVKIDPKMVEAVREVETLKSGKRPDLVIFYQSIPKSWLPYIRQSLIRGSGITTIPVEDGSYAVVENRTCAYNQFSNTLDGIPLQGAFDSLQRYRLLAAGDFAVAWNVKNMMTLISEGDPKDKDYTPTDQSRINKLMQTFTNPDYAMTAVVDPTTQIRFVTPPLEVFNPIKYTQCEKEIKEVLNLPSFMWHSDGGGTFGAAVAEVNLLRQEVENMRMILQEEFFKPLYRRLRTNSAKRPGFASKDIPLPIFDQGSLRDQVTWLQNCGELYNQGAISVETLLEENGFNPEWEIAQKKNEHEELGNKSTGAEGEIQNTTPMKPLFEASQGQTSVVQKKPVATKKPAGKSGRPASGTGDPADGKSTPRNPRTK